MELRVRGATCWVEGGLCWRANIWGRDWKWERCFWGGTKLPSVGMGLGSGRRERVSSSEQFMVGMVGLGFLLLGRRLKLFLLTWSLGCKYGPYLWEWTSVPASEPNACCVCLWTWGTDAAFLACVLPRVTTDWESVASSHPRWHGVWHSNSSCLCGRVAWRKYLDV